MAPISTSPGFSREEVGLALRNPGMPLEGLRYPITDLGDVLGPRGWTSWSSDRETRPGHLRGLQDNSIPDGCRLIAFSLALRGLWKQIGGEVKVERRERFRAGGR
jgi:hypothetical protein